MRSRETDVSSWAGVWPDCGAAIEAAKTRGVRVTVVSKSGTGGGMQSASWWEGGFSMVVDEFTVEITTSPPPPIRRQEPERPGAWLRASRRDEKGRAGEERISHRGSRIDFVRQPFGHEIFVKEGPGRSRMTKGQILSEKDDRGGTQVSIRSISLADIARHPLLRVPGRDGTLRTRRRAQVGQRDPGSPLLTSFPNTSRRAPRNLATFSFSMMLSHEPQAP